MFANGLFVIFLFIFPLYFRLNEITSFPIYKVETYNYDVNDKDYFGGTGLHYSCSNGHFKLATYLLKNNARILTDRFGMIN